MIQFQQDMSRLQGLTRNEAHATALVQQLTTAGQQKTAELAYVVSLYSAGDHQAAFDWVRTGVGKHFMDEARQATAALLDVEERSSAPPAPPSPE